MFNSAPLIMEKKDTFSTCKCTEHCSNDQKAKTLYDWKET